MVLASGGPNRPRRQHPSSAYDDGEDSGDESDEAAKHRGKRQRTSGKARKRASVQAAQKMSMDLEEEAPALGKARKRVSAQAAQSVATVLGDDVPAQKPGSVEKRAQHASDAEESVDEAFSSSDEQPRGYDPTKPRVRPPHHLSEGESDNEDPRYAYRALRSDEEDPFAKGLSPPEGAVDKTLDAHVRAGTGAKEKSDWISLTRSRKTAGAWSVDKKKKGRVVRVKLPPSAVDLNDPDQLSAAGVKGTASGFAKGSQEVAVKGEIPAANVTDVWDTTPVGPKEATSETRLRIRSRTQAQVKDSSTGRKKMANPKAVAFSTQASSTKAADSLTNKIAQQKGSGAASSSASPPPPSASHPPPSASRRSSGLGAKGASSSGSEA